VAPSKGFLRFLEVKNAKGVNYLNPGSVELSLGDQFFQYVNAVVVPPRSTDPAIVSSDTFIVTAEARTDTGTAIATKPITFTVKQQE